MHNFSIPSPWKCRFQCGCPVQFLQLKHIPLNILFPFHPIFRHGTLSHWCILVLLFYSHLNMGSNQSRIFKKWSENNNNHNHFSNNHLTNQTYHYHRLPSCLLENFNSEDFGLTLLPYSFHNISKFTITKKWIKEGTTLTRHCNYVIYVTYIW